MPQDMENNYRDTKGRFLPGHPGAKPKGAVSKRARLRHQLEGASDVLIASAIAQAMSGDTQLLALFIKLLIPNGIPAEIASGDPVESFAEGEISARELKDILSAVEKAKNIEEIDAIRTRLAELEKLLGQSRG